MTSPRARPDPTALPRLAALLAVMALAACDTSGPEGPTTFVTPLEGSENADWFYGALPNHGEDQTTVQDYQCGDKTLRFQIGTDFILPSLRSMDDGVDVLAAATGTVIETVDGYPDRHLDALEGRPGNRVTVRHAAGWETTYRHLKQGSIRVQEGARVEEGAVLGEAGSSGDSNWPRLGFEVRSAEGRVLDPWAGPCGGPSSFWRDQAEYPDGFRVIDQGTTDQATSLGDIALRPPDVTVFQQGQSFVFWVHVLNRPAGRLTIRLVGPAQTQDFNVDFPEPDPDNMVMAGTLQLRSDAEPGAWALEFAMNGESFARLDFDVTAAATAPAPARSAGVELMTWLDGPTGSGPTGR